MDEDEVRALAREEIRKAFEELSERADFWRDDGELKGSAAYVLSDAADNVAEKLLPPAPEPVNPFAPKRSAQEWADLIRDLIRQAEADGYAVWDGREYPDSPVYLKIGTKDSAPDEDTTIWGPL